MNWRCNKKAIMIHCRQFYLYFYSDDLAATIVNSESFKSKNRIIEKTPADDNTMDTEITVPLKYLINFRRTLGMSLINCEIGETKFAITSTKLYVPVVTLSNQDTAILRYYYITSAKLFQ